MIDMLDNDDAITVVTTANIHSYSGPTPVLTPQLLLLPINLAYSAWRCAASLARIFSLVRVLCWDLDPIILPPHVFLVLS